MAMLQRPPSLSECPSGPDSLHFPAYWYRLSQIPEFLVCTKCFEEKIAPTQLTLCFELFYNTPDPGKNATCMLNGITIDRILNDAIRLFHGDLDTLETLYAHATSRSQARHCPGTDGAAIEQGIRWFGVHQIPDFMVCEACYLDLVCGSNFATYFAPYRTQQQPGHVWSCDVAIPNVKKHLIADSTRHDWAAFINATSHQMCLPKCDGSEQSLSRRNWYTPSTMPNMLICETCYLDEVQLTPNTNQFRELRSDWMYAPSPNSTGRCAFAQLAIRVCNNQLLERDFGRWIHTVNRISYLPECPVDIVWDADWYLLIDPWTQQATDFGLCEACYMGCAESSNNSNLFRRERRAGSRRCEFSMTNTRMADSVPSLTETLFTRDFTSLIAYARCLKPQPIGSAVVQYQSLPNSQAGNAQGSNSQAGSSNWQAVSVQLAQQHAMNMSMSNMIFAGNSMHNAAMQGIWDQGSSYNKWHDSSYTQAQWNYTQAQNQMFSAMGSGRSPAMGSKH